MYLTMSWAQGGWVRSTSSTAWAGGSKASSAAGIVGFWASGLATRVDGVEGLPAPGVDANLDLSLSGDIEGCQSTSM